MTRALGIVVTTAVVLTLVADPATAQGRRGGHGGTRGGGSATAPVGGGSGQPAPKAVSRGDGGPRADGGSRGGEQSRDGGRAQGSPSNGDGNHPVTTGARPREGQPVTGQAVERRPEFPGNGRPIIVNRGGYYTGFYPWGYGGLGLGGYYYDGFYDPWWYGGYAASYGYGYDGALKLKVRPREASVYVDGYFAGRVDDFDGVFQSLKIEAGPHRIEIRQDGYEPLMFEVRIQPDRTVTYTGELKRLEQPRDDAQ